MQDETSENGNDTSDVTEQKKLLKVFAIVHESVTVCSPRLTILDENHLSFSGEKLWI